MRLTSLRSKLLRYLICYVIAVAAILAPYQANAIYDGTRSASYDSTTSCDTTDGGKYLAFDPFGNNIDYEFDFSNPVCGQIAAGVGAAAVAGWGTAKIACSLLIGSKCPTNTTLKANEDIADAASGPMTPAPSPTWSAKLLLYTGACTARTVNTPTCCSIPPTPTNCSLGSTDTALCCSGAATLIAAISATLAALAIIHGKGNMAYNSARICGVDWQAWQLLDSNGNQTSDGIWTKVKGPYQLCLRKLFLAENNTGASNDCGNDNNRVISNKAYRELIYGGIEREDKGDGACTNPSTWDDKRKNEILGYSSNNQRYYTTGPGSAPTYACQRFLARPKSDPEGRFTATEDQTAMQAAYECCKNRSQNAICIENRGGSRTGNSVTSATDYTHKFCNIGTTSCHVGDVDFQIYASLKSPNYVCAKTYSVCPYNHLLGGGSETLKVDEKGNSINFCQHLKHCSKLPLLPYVRSSDLTAGYIDSSCRDMRGDSQNTFGYDAELLPINTKGFTAPIVQCFKETMQNMFLNQAGYTKCIDPDESPDEYGSCPNGAEFVKGLDLPGDSFFIKIQKRFQFLIRIVLTLSVTLYGVMVLFAVPKASISRKTLFPYILKLALVCYFTLGNAWQAVFIKDLLNASSYLSAITFRPDNTSGPSNKLDGCQFPRYNYAAEESVEKYYPVDAAGNPDNSKLSYPPGKQYLEVWDVLDCKIALALGYGPEVSVPNLIFMILGGFLTAGFGLVFVVAAFCFAFFMIFVAIRALQFFLVAITAIIILLYLSTFIIPLCLFSRTKGIFESWWKEILSFTLQPLILFAYLGVLIAIFNNVVIGSATFTPSTFKIGSESKLDEYGRYTPKSISCNGAAKDDSIYCIFRVADIKTYNGLEALGIGLPMLTSINVDKLASLIKGALIMFIFSKFMDNINTIAAELTGGTKINTGWEANFTPSSMAMGSYDKLRDIQKRGMRLTKKGGSMVRSGITSLSNLARDLGDKGKSSTGNDAIDGVGSRSGGAGANDHVGSRSGGANSAVDEVSNRNPNNAGGSGSAASSPDAAAASGGTASPAPTPTPSSAASSSENGTNDEVGRRNQGGSSSSSDTAAGGTTGRDSSSASFEGDTSDSDGDNDDTTTSSPDENQPDTGETPPVPRPEAETTSPPPAQPEPAASAAPGGGESTETTAPASESSSPQPPIPGAASSVGFRSSTPPAANNPGESSPE